EAFVTREIRNRTLLELQRWNSRLRHNPHWDANGLAARRFWVAQTLVNTLLADPFGSGGCASDDAVKILEDGAMGLLEFGSRQFQELKATAHELVNWILNKRFENIVVLECPLGNTVSTRRRPPCRRDRAFDLNGACMSAAKNRGSWQDGDHYRS
ncbi:MAG TPA: hypothetical protein VFR68_11415, partial [Candidatus Dormibacteraeota bacterium]|nr:hypothetical protein [Candidatus Dormibacteraeota bacterium]